jgi:hypothetical protein
MREVAAGDAVDVVEATAEVGAGEPVADSETPVQAGALAVAEPSGPFALPVPMRLAELTLVAWRQPAVRAAVKTGASALALSLALRAARHILTHPGARRAVTRSALPSLSGLLQPESSDGREHGAMVIETYVYMRRVIRR